MVRRESDYRIVSMKRGNACGEKAGNTTSTLKGTHSPHTEVDIPIHRGGDGMETKLARIAQIAKERPKEKFTSLAHLLNVEILKTCHRAMKSGKAAGIDEMTKAVYEENLDGNVTDLVARLKRKAYHPQPARRTYIPKEGTDKMRPLGIPAYEDKLVQAGLTKIMNAIYEEDFLGCSFGFRPNRNQHDALKVLNYIMERKKISYIVDADITGFFEHVDHEWMMKFLGYRIGDPSIHRIIKRILKAGYMEDGRKYVTEEGTPQGGVISPLLANIYLHYVLDLWFSKRVKRQCRGEAYMVRFADDFVCCFQYRDDAENFYRGLQERLQEFNLAISAEKSKIIPFGRFAQEQSAKEGKNKPDTFNFLGFTHYCSKSRTGKFRVKRKTSRKKFRTAVVKMNKWLEKVRNRLPIGELVEKLRTKLQGHFNYYGLTDNYRALKEYRDKTIRLVFKWLNRRSQRKSFTWDKYKLFLKQCNLPKPRITVNIWSI